MFFYNNLTHFQRGYYFCVFGSLQLLALSVTLIFSLRVRASFYHLLWNSSTSCLLVMTNAFKDSVRCKPSHMSILLDCNSCVTGKVISNTLLVSTKQATNWKVEANVKKDETFTYVSLLHVLSTLIFTFSKQ